MQVSDIRIILSDNDILSIIKDYVKIPGLEVEKVKIDNTIELKGYIKKGVKVSFSLSVTLLGYNKNKLMLDIHSIKVGYLGIFDWLKNFTLKKVLKTFKEMGIVFNEKTLTIDTVKILDQLPFYIKFSIKEIFLLGGKVNLNIEQLILK